MKFLTVISFALFLTGILLFLGQMWFNILSEENFVKIVITDGALLAITLVLNFLIKENKQSDKIHNDRSLN